ncbi:hypothetical protein AGMMS50225_08470 [Betaproteobacteria bacterium]|nr:hypothetical protein AGMMS50225_08470 [Betaproteobacteria bacterium]
MLENRNLTLAERREQRLAALAEKAARDADLLRLHQFAAEVLCSEDGPAVRAQALAHVEIWARGELCHPDYITGWRRILDMTPEERRRSPMLREDAQGVAFRQNTPLGFVRERLACQ